MNHSIRYLFPLALMFSTGTALAQSCPYRGQLDDLYCDADRDMVADTPTDQSKWKNPATLVFTYAPVEDPAVYQKIFTNLLDHLSQCTGKKVVYFQVHSYAAQVEAMRSGRLHISNFSPGTTPFAVNLAGAVPVVVPGNAEGPRAYHMAVIVKKDSPYQTLTDLKGKKVAHVEPSSNSGNLAPRALLPAEGLTPDKDYKVFYSGKHDQSILGVNSGDYDAAIISDSVLTRMSGRGVVKAENFRALYTSPPFIIGSFAYSHDLDPALATKIKGCFMNYKFTAEMTKEFLGDDRFHAMNYQRDLAVVRKIAEDTGTVFNRAGFDRENAAAADAKKK